MRLCNGTDRCIVSSLICSSVGYTSVLDTRTRLAVNIIAPKWSVLYQLRRAEDFETSYAALCPKTKAHSKILFSLISPYVEKRSSIVLYELKLSTIIIDRNCMLSINQHDSRLHVVFATSYPKLYSALFMLSRLICIWEVQIWLQEMCRTNS